MKNSLGDILCYKGEFVPYVAIDAKGTVCTIGGNLFHKGHYH